MRANSSSGGGVRLVLGVHSHQPVGNFDDVFARALADAYDPFLDALERHPGVTAVLHYSGSLCEWLDVHAPQHLDRVSDLARAGRVELLTGGFYEPILPLIPRWDRVGQIRMQTRYIKERFGVTARGMWLAERVWEPTLPGTLREAGVDYTVLDDYHFLSSLDRDPVGGYYLTEDQGEAVRLFPISERLRYLIPFREPAETIEWLRSLGRDAPAGSEPVAVIIDDGEKFGMWPGTRAWVHGEPGRTGWLESFFTALEENASWLKTTTLARVVSDTDPSGRVYLPPSSYFEMGEWALPPQRGRQFEAIVASARSRDTWASERPFLRGGFFRNYLAKYSESLLMVRRAQTISRMMEGETARSALDHDGRPSHARRELWRAMCNCSYWHGIFGGLYLPHIRRAVGEHLCRARRLFESEHRPGGGLSQASARFVDLDADGDPEVEIQTEDLSLLVDPAGGGAITVFDLRGRDYPLGSTLTRRLETYHDAMLRQRADDGGADHASIHEVAIEASEDLKRLLVVDDRPRASAVDRFLRVEASAADLAAGRPAECGDFFNGRYAATLVHEADMAGVALTREGTVDGCPLTLTKTIRTGRSGRRLVLRHRLGPSGPSGLGSIDLGGARLGVEFNFALIESEGRIVLLEGAGAGVTLSLSDIAESAPVSRLRIEEDHAGFALTVRVEPEAQVWHYPVRTVSRSEKGYEPNYQGSALVLVWPAQATRLGETLIEVEVAYRA